MIDHSYDRGDNLQRLARLKIEEGRTTYTPAILHQEDHNKMHRSKITRIIRVIFALTLMLSAFAVVGNGPALAKGDVGAVYLLTNQAAGNSVAIFDRAADGT